MTAPSGWWQTGNTIVGGTNVGQACTQAIPCSFPQLLAAYPNAGIRPITGQCGGQPVAGGVWLKVGSNWANGFTGNVDSLTAAVKVGGVNGTVDLRLRAVREARYLRQSATGTVADCRGNQALGLDGPASTILGRERDDGPLDEAGIALGAGDIETALVRLRPRSSSKTRRSPTSCSAPSRTLDDRFAEAREEWETRPEFAPRR